MLDRLYSPALRVPADYIHPGDYDQIVALQDETKRMQEYESTHKVKTLADKRRESEIIIKQVMEDMKGKWHLDVADADMPQSSDLQKHTKPKPQKLK